MLSAATFLVMSPAVSAARSATALRPASAVALQASTMVGLSPGAHRPPAVPGAGSGPGQVADAPSSPTAVFSAADGVSCISASDCLAVGSYQPKGPLTKTLAERWNGSAWSVVRSPNPPGAMFSVLNGISCASARRCLAAGSYTNSSSVPVTLTESWNGAAWSVVPSPNPSGATSGTLQGLSCTSATRCMAVGYYINSSSATNTLAESWNGSAWSVVPSPNPSGATFSTLQGISCASAAMCMAAGLYTSSSSVDVTLTESWNGSAWSVVPSPSPPGAGYSVLHSVSCARASHCVAVGESYNAAAAFVTLSESWNGSAWSIVSSPTLSTSSDLYGISCASASRCLAAGTFQNSSGNYATLAESWKDRAWSIVNQDADLAGVSCASALRCLAIGSYISSHSVSVNLAESWNGSAWSVVRIPSPRGARGSYLNGISCLPTGRCLAVGYYFNHRFIRVTLTESWNGSAWSIVRSPSPPGAPYSALDAISCTSASDCTAVGSSAGGTLAEHWNGSAWSVISTPNPATSAYSELDGISCLNRSDCLAVGYYYNTVAGANLTLAERWNGSAWSIVPSPAPGSAQGLESGLDGISCRPAGRCLAVGTYQRSSGNYATLTEDWTGTKWVLVPSPNPPGTIYSELHGIACLPTGRCMAAGNYYNQAGNYVTLSERWSGMAWSIVHSPNPPVHPPSITYLQSISCPSASNCLATGAYGNPANLYPLSESWNGSAWRLVPTRR